VLDNGYVSHNTPHIVNHVISIQRNLNQSLHGAMNSQTKVFFHDFLQSLEKNSWVVPKNGHNHIRLCQTTFIIFMGFLNVL